jgi:hypothetical protein
MEKIVTIHYFNRKLMPAFIGGTGFPKIGKGFLL